MKAVINGVATFIILWASDLSAMGYKYWVVLLGIAAIIINSMRKVD